VLGRGRGQIPLHKPPCVPLAVSGPGPLAPTAGPDPGSWPAPSKNGMFPLPLASASGDALRVLFLVFSCVCFALFGIELV